ncbi:FHA domain-containing protein, partial [Campylobacter coli]
ENMFIKYIEAAIQNNIKEDKILFENLTIKALEKYIKDFE